MKSWLERSSSGRRSSCWFCCPLKACASTVAIFISEVRYYDSAIDNLVIVLRSYASFRLLFVCLVHPWIEDLQAGFESGGCGQPADSRIGQ